MTEAAGIGARAARRPGWEEVFTENYPGLVRHLSRLLGDRAAAEDLAQEAFVRLMRRPPPRAGDLGGWLRVAGTRLAYNYLRDERRRRARERSVAGDPALRAAADAGVDAGAGVGADAAGDGADAAEAATGDAAADAAARAAALQRALARLTPRDRMVLLLRASGAPYGEVAASMGMAAGSVGTTLARATRRLRAAYTAVEAAGEGDGGRGAPQ